MRLTSRRRILVLFLVLLVGAAARVALWRPLLLAGEAPRDGYVRVRGVSHVHTVASEDAGGTVDDVLAAARATGLDFVVVTDHNTMANKEAEGWRDGVLAVV